MKGDFSRDPRSSAGSYAGVLMQQGRVQLDTDFNAQSAIACDRLRTLARDLVGLHGGPADRLGFGCITHEDGLRQWLSRCSESDAMASKDFVGSVDWTRDFLITPGRYYVDGMLAENDRLVRYAHHADSAARNSSLGHGQALYLRVFERVVTGSEDSRLRDLTLGGADTTLRLEVGWQIALVPARDGCTSARDLPVEWRSRYGLMTARTRPGGYQGNENRLYRIEIHTGAEAGTPSFKWSRNNGAVVRAVRQPPGDQVNGQLTVELLTTAAMGGAGSIDVNAFVELLPAFDPGPHVQGPLLRVLASAHDGSSLTLDTTGVAVDAQRVRVVRRWDQQMAAILIPVAATPIGVEDGLEIVFDAGTRSDLRPGDYWTVPATTAVADIDWPQALDPLTGLCQPIARPPDGPRWASAPLGMLRTTRSGAGLCFEDARRRFVPLAT